MLAILFCTWFVEDATAQFERPVGVTSVGRQAIVVNQGNKTLTVVENGRAVVSSITTRSSPTAIVQVVGESTPDFLVADSEGLMRGRIGDSGIGIVDRLPLPQPGHVAIDTDSAVVVVTSRWDLEAHIVRLQPKLAIAGTVELPFVAGQTAAIGNGRFLVADAFGGSLAVLDATSGDVISRSQLRGHNIRGLLRNGEEVLIAHQILSQTARTELADVHWGTLMQNVISRVTIDSLLAGKPKSSTIALGDVENGAADPGRMVRLPDGRIAVVLSGVDEVLISPLPDRRGRFRFAKGTRIKVGARPTSLAVTPDGNLVVTNKLSNSVSMVDVDAATSRQVLAENSTERNAAERGEIAFFSAKLSHDGWLSCHSCHTSGHTPGLLADTLGDDAFGNPKLIPSLLGVGSTKPFGWSGNFDRLSDQIAKSIRTTMHGTPDETTAEDIAAYLRSLELPTGSALPATRNGLNVFRKHDCVRCHVPANGFTSSETYDVGFKDESGQARFNPPSLRGVGRRFRFFHDGRATSLSEALRLHTQGLNKQVESADLQQLEQFLRGL